MVDAARSESESSARCGCSAIQNCTDDDVTTSASGTELAVAAGAAVEGDDRDADKVQRKKRVPASTMLGASTWLPPQLTIPTRHWNVSLFGPVGVQVNVNRVPSTSWASAEYSAMSSVSGYPRKPCPDTTSIDTNLPTFSGESPGCLWVAGGLSARACLARCSRSSVGTASPAVVASRSVGSAGGLGASVVKVTVTGKLISIFDVALGTLWRG